MVVRRNLGKKLEDIDGLKDKAFTILGLEMTPATIGAAVALLSTVCGTLYGGFVMYQKVEEVASMDLGAYQQQMEVMDAKVQEALADTRPTVPHQQVMDEVQAQIDRKRRGRSRA